MHNLVNSSMKSHLNNFNSTNFISFSSSVGFELIGLKCQSLNLTCDFTLVRVLHSKTQVLSQTQFETKKLGLFCIAAAFL